MKDLYDLFILDLKKMYMAEEKIVEALPKMIKAASTSKLKEAFQDHLKETKQQVHRLEQVFRLLNEKPAHSKSLIIEALLGEGEQIIKSKFDPLLKDAALIAAAQKVEHFEIAAYGALKAYARHFHLEEVEELLDMNSEEEGKANKHLTELAEGHIFGAGINKEAFKRTA